MHKTPSENPKNVESIVFILIFAIKSLSGAYLWKYRMELNETWYIDRWPSEEVQNAGKDAWVSVCLAICPYGVISFTYILDARLIFFSLFFNSLLKITY